MESDGSDKPERDSVLASAMAFTCLLGKDDVDASTPSNLSQTLLVCCAKFI